MAAPPPRSTPAPLHSSVHPSETPPVQPHSTDSQRISPQTPTPATAQATTAHAHGNPATHTCAAETQTPDEGRAFATIAH
eukprot:762296-Amphidinium_carterae.1